MRRLEAFTWDRRGLVGADFALIMMLVLVGRHIAMCHGTQIAALLKPVLGA